MSETPEKLQKELEAILYWMDDAHATTRQLHYTSTIVAELLRKVTASGEVPTPALKAEIYRALEDWATACRQLD